ncbi:MFS transporter [Streptomyces sp. NPDC006285]|uniref:MFS transporter n=1 Tax=Streptomyces sp. NPDC006285 TaxID=3364742 RepID=UPI0036897825
MASVEQQVQEPADDKDALNSPSFRRLWVANGFRNLAGDISTFALPITATLFLGASPLEIGLIVAVGNAGFLFLGLPAGVWIDRWNQRTVLILADLVYGFSLVSVPAAYFFHSLTIAHLIAVSFSIGIANTFFSIAHSSILPFILPKRLVADANARLQTTDNAIGSVAPSLAGVLSQTIAAPYLYLMGSLLHFSSLRMIGRIDIRKSSSDNHTQRHFRTELSEGIREIFSNQIHRLFLIQTVLNNLGAGILMSTSAYYMLRVLHISPWLFGTLSSVGALTGVVASMLCRKLRILFGEIRMTLVFSWIAPVSVALLPLAQVFRPAATELVIASTVIGAFSLAGRAISVAGIRARITPRKLLGRVSAANATVSMGIVVVGSLAGGAISTGFSVTFALWIALASMTIPALWIINSPLRSIRTLPKEWEVAD